MVMILISEDENYEPILGEVRRQDEYNDLTKGVFETDSDIILAKYITSELLNIMDVEGNYTFEIRNNGDIIEYDVHERTFCSRPTDNGYVANVVTMLLWSQPKPSNYEFLIHQMKTIKSMTKDKNIRRHIDATLKEIKER